MTRREFIAATVLRCCSFRHGVRGRRGGLGELLYSALGQMSLLVTLSTPHGSAACARRAGSNARTYLSNIVLPQIACQPWPLSWWPNSGIHNCFGIAGSRSP